jgi:hypothetical protein
MIPRRDLYVVGPPATTGRSHSGQRALARAGVGCVGCHIHVQVRRSHFTAQACPTDPPARDRQLGSRFERGNEVV